MKTDPRVALGALVAALQTHLELTVERRGEDDPRVVAAYQRIADTFVAYDDALLDAYGEVTPLDIYSEDDEEALDEDNDEDLEVDDVDDDLVDEDQLDDDYADDDELDIIHSDADDDEEEDDDADSVAGDEGRRS